jgi:hypothetical protein
MRKTKIGSLLVIAILALAGIGVAYAGFTDTLTIKGDVDTATVSMEVVGYSGTYVYKVWDFKVEGMTEMTEDDLPDWWAVEEFDPAEEVLVLSGFNYELPSENKVMTFFDGSASVELVSYAQAKPYDGDDYDVHMVYDNLFPCKDFTADFVIKYTGSVPAKLWADISSNDGWLNELADIDGEIEIFANKTTIVDGEWVLGESVDVGHQVHTGDYVYIALKIHLPQENKWQDKDGEFFATITALQWNEDESALPTN